MVRKLQKDKQLESIKIKPKGPPIEVEPIEEEAVAVVYPTPTALALELNSINTQISDIDTTKAASIPTNDLSTIDLPAASGVYDASQVQELIDTVNTLKDKVHNMNNF